MPDAVALAQREALVRNAFRPEYLTVGWMVIEAGVAIGAGRHQVCNLTAITPIDADTTEINHCIYWTAPWLSALRPLLRPYVRTFLHQDRRIMERQRQGLRWKPPLMLIDDADTQTKWYYRLKREYRRARAEGRPFVNPIRPRTLEWRS